MLGVEFFSSDKFRLFNWPFLTEFFLLFRLSIQSNRVFVLGVDFSFFGHISTIQLAIFDGIFLLFRLSIQSNEIFVLGVEFFSSNKFRLFN